MDSDVIVVGAGLSGELLLFHLLLFADTSYGKLYCVLLCRYAETQKKLVSVASFYGGYIKKIGFSSNFFYITSVKALLIQENGFC